MIDGAKKSSPLGLNTLKAFFVLIMIIIHGVAWFLIHSKLKMNWEEVSLVNVLVSMIGMLSLSIPATAGAMLRVRLTPYLSNNRLFNFPFSKHIKIFCFLALIESLRQGLIWGGMYFFYWNVLHFFALSSIVILMLGKKNIKLVLPVSLGIFVFAQLMGDWGKALQWKVGAVLPIDDFSLAIKIILTLFFLVSGEFLRRFFKNKFSYFFSLISLILIGGTWFWTFSDPTFLTQVLNLPMAFFFGSTNWFHIWPFGYWFVLPATGFFIWDLFLSGRIKNLTWLLVTSILGLIFFYWFDFRSFFWSINRQSLWSPELFSPRPSTMVGILSVFVLFAWLANHIENFYLKRDDGIYRMFSFLVGLLSRHIFAAYLISSSLPTFFSPLLKKASFSDIWFFGSFIVLLTVALLYALEKVDSFRKLTITLVKKTS